MQRSTKRWLLSPITQWRAVRFSARQGNGIDVQTAWILVRLRRNPAEAEYVLTESGLPKSPNPGVRYDDWDTLSHEERSRRRSWLARHGESPFQLLGITADFIVRAGIEVTDWGPPPDGPTQT
jgi:hypothetical protein